jgi:predicted DNA binding CopG/RHH family protein
MKPPLKKFPVLLTDEDAERFVDEADLSEYDFSGFKRMKFELINKDVQVELSLPQALLAKIKSRAAAEGIPCQRFMRDLMERGLEPAAKRQ